MVRTPPVSASSPLAEKGLAIRTCRLRRKVSELFGRVFHPDGPGRNATNNVKTTLVIRAGGCKSIVWGGGRDVQTGCACVSSCIFADILLTLLQDKRAVEAYKAEIKAKLTRAGLIRGQPRSSIIQATSSSSSAVFATEQYQGPANGSTVHPLINDTGAPSLTIVNTTQAQAQGESPTTMSMFGEHYSSSPVQRLRRRSRITTQLTFQHKLATDRSVAAAAYQLFAIHTIHVNFFLTPVTTKPWVF